MKVATFILALVVVILSSFSLLVGNYITLPYALLLLGVMLVLIGVSQFNENRKATAITLFLVAGFNLVVTVYLL
ncbi:DUF3953 domain-containing protein [Bacillus marinisedimentorum]|uniref:DUF3953 domain-containing protein n=1 Tax=Bacillus marinisedimentorum TaxID=1821260 RepID=UPI0008732BED|nr:DUF3953 domain-containing protein [Bacillus marinisedimentorum]